MTNNAELYKTGISKHLNARHYLEGDFGEESIPHSHPYRVEFICETGTLDKNGFSVDIAFLEDNAGEVLDNIDNVLLNDLPFFERKQPSLENLCVYIWTTMQDIFKKAASSPDPDSTDENSLPQNMEIKIWESETAWASFKAPIQ